MTDAKNDGLPFDTRALYLSDAALKEGIYLLLLASRNIMSKSDELLNESNLGHAHARALFFISYHQGLSVTELIGYLGVTKQSLNRVLGDLLKAGYVERRISRDDKRRRMLYLTASGQAVADAVWSARRPLISEAFKSAGQDAVAGFRKVLAGMSAVDPSGRSQA